jgi:hypothetical protein
MDTDITYAAWFKRQPEAVKQDMMAQQQRVQQAEFGAVKPLTLSQFRAKLRFIKGS